MGTSSLAALLSVEREVCTGTGDQVGGANSTSMGIGGYGESSGGSSKPAPTQMQMTMPAAELKAVPVDHTHDTSGACRRKVMAQSVQTCQCKSWQ